MEKRYRGNRAIGRAGRRLLGQAGTRTGMVSNFFFG
jgi:hypothetical protein